MENKKPKQDVASLLCLIAGWTLVAEWFIESIASHKLEDLLQFSIGLYFIGKGLFLKEIIEYLRSLNRPAS